MIEKQPFRAYKLDEEKNDKFETISLKLNEEERTILNQCKTIIEQKKDGTAIKQLMHIGAKVIQDEKMAVILATLFKNKRKNTRVGIADFE